MSPRFRSVTVLAFSLGLAMSGQVSAQAVTPAHVARTASVSQYDDPSSASPEDFRDWMCRWVPMACGRA